MIAEAFFRWQVLTRGEPYLARFSAHQSELLAELAGRRVAIVGNARSLGDGTLGAAIDDHDLVIRMHRAPLPSPQSHGSRTDWLALGVPVEQEVILDRAPKRLLWMARKRKRLSRRIATAPGFYRHPPADWRALAAELGAPPSTGIMLIDLVSRSGAEAIDLFGFDFFASLSMTGRRTADQVPHDFDAERRWVEALMARDGRVVLHRPSD